MFARGGERSEVPTRPRQHARPGRMGGLLAVHVLCKCMRDVLHRSWILMRLLAHYWLTPSFPFVEKGSDEFTRVIPSALRCHRFEEKMFW